MKTILVLLLVSAAVVSAAQPTSRQKADSVCQLLLQSLQSRAIPASYALISHQSKKNLPTLSQWQEYLDQSLYTYGPLQTSRPLGKSHRMFRYEWVFARAIVNVDIRLDDQDKIGTLGFSLSDDQKAPGHYELHTSNPLTSELDKVVDKAVRPYMMKKQTVGMAIGVLMDGKVSFYGYGETDRGNGVIPDQHTLFEIGSITKTFTTTLLELAAVDGKLSLDEPVNKYLPDSIPALVYDGIPVTLKTMANHTSGLPRDPPNLHPPDPANEFKGYYNQDLFSFYRHFRLTQRPGKRFAYSNLAVGTLGVILEEVYRQSYETLVRCRTRGHEAL
jgi:CubicO group peptidase (beta-lactamase class C family)